jgi:hypothetical protein
MAKASTPDPVARFDQLAQAMTTMHERYLEAHNQHAGATEVAEALGWPAEAEPILLRLGRAVDRRHRAHARLLDVFKRERRFWSF